MHQLLNLDGLLEVGQHLVDLIISLFTLAAVLMAWRQGRRNNALQKLTHDRVENVERQINGRIELVGKVAAQTVIDKLTQSGQDTHD